MLGLQRGYLSAHSWGGRTNSIAPWTGVHSNGYPFSRETGGIRHGGRRFFFIVSKIAFYGVTSRFLFSTE